MFVFEQRLMEENRMRGYRGYLKFCALVEKTLQGISSGIWSSHSSPRPIYVELFSGTSCDFQHDFWFKSFYLCGTQIQLLNIRILEWIQNVCPIISISTLPDLSLYYLEVFMTKTQGLTHCFFLLWMFLLCLTMINMYTCAYYTQQSQYVRLN